MAKFIYEGDSGELALDGARFPRGEAVEVSDELAERLAEHPDFSQAGDEPKAKKSSKPAGTGSGSGAPSALAERAALVARAKELGIPAKGKSDALAAAIAEAEAASQS